MNHVGVTISFAVVLALFLSGWSILDSRPGSTPSSPSASQTYSADGFTVHLPPGLAAHAYTLQDGQDILTFETHDGKTGFQVFTMPANEALPATAEKLREGLPEMLVENFQHTSVNGTPAISFFSHDTDIGDTFEVWFVHNSLLYQVMTYRPQDAWLDDILQTLTLR